MPQTVSQTVLSKLKSTLRAHASYKIQKLECTGLPIDKSTKMENILKNESNNK